MDTGHQFQTNTVAITEMRRALTSLVRFHAFAFRVSAEWIHPKFDLSLRIALAQSFFISGMMVSMHMRPSGLEQPLMHLQALMRPFNQSQVAPIAEIVSATLLAAGLFTQLSAFALLLFTLAGASPLGGDPRLLVCALLVLYIIGGAEAFSMDALFGGLASSALTIAAQVLRLAQCARHYILPVIESVLRVLLGLSLLAGGRLIPVGLHYL